MSFLQLYLHTKGIHKLYTNDIINDRIITNMFFNSSISNVTATINESDLSEDNTNDIIKEFKNNKIVNIVI